MTEPTLVSLFVRPLNQLRYFQIGGSERHLRDIASMLQVSDALVDRAALECWAARLGVIGEWARAQELK